MQVRFRTPRALGWLVLVAAGTTGVAENASDASLAFAKRTVRLTGRPQAVVAARLDGDAFVDLALLTLEPTAGGSHARLSVFGGGAAGLAAVWASDLGETGASHALRAFDVNADGWLDLSVPGIFGVGALRPGDGTLVYGSAVHVPTAGGAVVDLVFADFTGDGLRDSLMAVDDIGGHFLDSGANVGGLSFAVGSSVSIPPAGGFHPHLLCEDLDGDGVASHVIIASTAGLTCFEFGVWPPAFTVHPGVFGEAATADLDADGDRDVVATMPLRGPVRSLLNLGGGVLAPSASFETGQLPSHVAVSDVDGDGFVDVVVTNEGSGTVAVLANDGAGALAALAPIHVDGAPTGVEAVDLDADGDVDLVVIDELGRTLSILQNQRVP